MASDLSSFWHESSGSPEITGAAGPIWRSGGPGKPPSSARRRILMLSLGWISFLSVCAGLFYLATWLLPARPGALILLAASYEDNLAFPLNVSGQAGLETLADYAQGKSTTGNLFRLHLNGIQDLASDTAWERIFSKIPESNLVVFLSAHGGLDEKGPYLLPTDARVYPAEGQRIRVEELLERLKKLPPQQKKLLILECNHMAAHWPLGQLHNDFVRGLARLEEQIQSIPNLVLLCSSAEDQESWSSQELGGTVFTSILRDGLEGAADADGDRRVYLFELVQYLRKDTDAWVKANRGASQTPMIYPRGPEGENRARNMIVSQVGREKTPRKSAIPGTPSAPKLETAWKNFQRLRDELPSPAVHSPYLWQNFQAGLLRFEELLRWDRPTPASRWENRLAQWEKTIQTTGAGSLRSASNNLALDPPAGILTEAQEKQWKTFWESKTEDEARKAWTGWVKAHKENPAANPLAPRKFWFDLVLKKVELDPEANLEQAALLLRILREANTPLPAEAHFVVMLQRDLPGNPPAGEARAILTRALQVRRLAEEVACSSKPEARVYRDQIYPWIAGPIMEADRKRQWGQDLLFSANQDDWKKAGDWLLQAAEDYQAIARSADQVLNALALRDRLQAELPAYSQWWAQRPMTKLFEVPDPELPRLWSGLHQLIDHLNSEKKEPAELIAIGQTTQDLALVFANTEKFFQKFVTTLGNAPTVTHEEILSVWLETEAALAAPRFPPDLRGPLLARQSRLAKKLLQNHREQPQAFPASLGNDSVRSRARRQGEFALAHLGKTEFEAIPGDTFAQMKHRLEIFEVEEKWWQSMELAGRQLALRFQDQLQRIARLGQIGPKTDRPQVLADLRRADRLGRSLLVSSGYPLAGYDPVAAYRRVRTAEFLLAQTERTFQDHWFDDNPNAEPYFRAAGRRFLTEAESLVAGLPVPLGAGGAGPAYRPMLAHWQKLFAQPGELKVVEPAEKAAFLGDAARTSLVTSEQQFHREYRLVPFQAGDVIPPGFPVLWLESFKGIQPIQPRERERILVEMTPDRQSPEQAEPIRTTLVSPAVLGAEKTPGSTPVPERTALGLQGRFRGQVIQFSTPFELYPLPEMVIREYPLPEKASVAVRSQLEVQTKVGTNDSGIAFVIDASGSMRAPDGTPFEKSRYSQVLKALEAVLKRLPQDTTVSIWIFGQAVGGEKTVARAEDTIQQILPPTRWNAQDPRMIEAVLGQLAYPGPIEPWNESPLSRALLYAKNDLRTVKGYKTILALTDADDNRFQEDLALRTRFKTIDKMLQEEFDKGDVLLNILGFPALSKKEEIARQRFKVIEKFEPPGKLLFVEDAEKLALAMETILRQRLHYFVDRQGSNVNIPDTPPDGFDVSTAGSNYRWFGKGMNPGGHKVRVQLDQRYEKDVLLHRGDLLLLDLVPGPNGLVFERFLFSDEYPWKVPVENNRRDWRLTMLQNQQLGSNRLQMLLTMEKTVDRRENILEQIKPRDAWLEVDPEIPAPVSVRWNYLAGYPAPAWSVDVPAWPKAAGGKLARPLVKVWWNPDAEARPQAELDLKPLFLQTERAIPLGRDETVVLEQVSVEKHQVEVVPGNFQERLCLVVRARYQPGKQLITRVQGLAPQGVEHRLYEKAGKYTGLFWWDDNQNPLKDQGLLNAVRLRFISVLGFKREAEARDYAAELRHLQSPEPTDFRPRPPLDLK